MIKMELIQAAKSRIAEIARESKKIREYSDKGNVVCYFGENGSFIVKARANEWTVSNEITIPPNVTKKQVLKRLEALEKTQLEETQIAPIGNGQAEIEYHCATCGEPAGHQVVANGQTSGEQIGEIHEDCTPDAGENCQNCGAVFS